MKRVLITGANSYVGTSFETYVLENFADEYIVDTIDLIGGTWREKKFYGYDSIFHVAGIAHSDNGKISEERAKLYYSVNKELAVEVARRAKEEGVGQFIFMSSAIVYGESAPIGKMRIITRETPVNPLNCYSDSKVQAERELLLLEDDNFRVVILRSPMVYGKGSKGNYPLLSKTALNFPFFPEVDNKRSMIYIENLCEFVRLMIKNREKGVFWPQNTEYSNTSKMVIMIAKAHGKEIHLIKRVTWLLKLMSLFTNLVNKAFGSLIYDLDISRYKEKYDLYSLEQSINKSES